MNRIFLYNSRTRKKKLFVPLKFPHVGMYTCGQTVYDYTHIGHGRKYVMDDILRRVLIFNGYKVTHVQNITDVGHLVSDADEGEDKMEKGARKVGMTVWEVAEYYTDHFYKSMDKLNILRPNIVCKATEHIFDQIELIKRLLNKGFAYDTPEAVYFNIKKFPSYGEIFGQELSQKKVAAREDIKIGEFKKSPEDFALWFKRVGRFSEHSMHWNSPWGVGFPGWHIECSAMSMKYLGEQFDIHTGGVDHLSIHHPNEIAQSEAATGKKPFVKYWIHYAFLNIDGKKMSKSLGNLYTIEDIEKKGFEALALRYFYLAAHYKKTLNFTWEGLKGAQTAYQKLREVARSLKRNKNRVDVTSTTESKKSDGLKNEFIKVVNDDLNTPKALALVWEAIKSDITPSDKYKLLLHFDEVLGLGLNSLTQKKLKIPEAVRQLLKKREKLRLAGKYQESDKVRIQLEKLSFEVEDTKKGPKLRHES